MNTLIQHAGNLVYQKSARHNSTWARFLAWCHEQEENRFGWLSAAVMGHGCILTPLTLAVVMLSGNSMLFWAIAIAAMGMTLISNLAAMPTKITIPVFFLSILLDLGIVIACVVTASGITG